MAHRSFFSYNITRAYPFKWFTPVVIVGTIISIALVSFLNVAATGYELVSVSAQDPNATETNGIWFSKWPSYLVGARASCDPSNIPIQSTFYTDKKAFPYTLSKVWHNGEGNSKIYQGSMMYKNNLLQNCNISMIKIEFEGPDRTAGQFAVSPMGGTVTAISQCYVEADSPGGYTYFELVSTYDAIPPPTPVSSIFLGLNKTNDPSLYWGNALLGLYWRTAMQDFYDENVHRDPPFFKGHVELHHEPTSAGTMEEQVGSIDFLSVNACWFIPLNSTGIAFKYNRYCNTSSISVLAEGPEKFERPVPGIWRSVEVLGKAMWFTVMADLGRNDDAMPNMLARPALLANLSSNMTQANQTLRREFRWGLAAIDDQFLKNFDPTQSRNSQLRVNQSLLTTDYLCQIPQLKSPGNLFVSILVADLVILQTLWKIFTLIIDGFCIKDTEEAQSCTTCMHHSKISETPGGYESVSEQESDGILLGERRSINSGL
ncbi:hypothetical protein F4779DRAFT_579175 [Xylariaceae sp. FL0662B]|nr:hypothetical protein F4779DRAFT_579175 [Xylariaceae sp. FL0662B]